MCTLIVARNVYKGFPVVVAANRDELLSRRSEPPKFSGTGWMTIAPKDLQRGGTWIGINGLGVLAALTNRLDVRSVGGRKSRGDIVTLALTFQSAAKAHEHIAAFSGGMFNGFNLVIADAHDLFLLRGNGEIITSTREGDGLLVVTNRGVGLAGHVGKAKRVRNILRVWNEDKAIKRWPTLSSLSRLLDIHDSGRHGTCIHEPQNDYGTKSSSIIRLDGRGSRKRWNYWHREKADLNHHACEAKFNTQFTLPIID